LSEASFTAPDRFEKRRASPKGRMAGAISFGSFSFSEKKMNKEI